MEVDRVSFPHHLLGVLTALSESHFVSLDLEFSGISSRPPNSRGKQTLEERYAETKAAAEKFTILQVGITCVHQDYQNDVYTVRPYNFNLSPLIDDQWNVDRIFSFQSGACQFLLKHGFQMDLPFTKGVGYLSRDEAKLAKQNAYARLSKGNIADINLKKTDTQSLEFVKNVRNAILAWKERQMKGSLRITSNVGKPNLIKNTEEEPQRISNFEKRLVHQLVRAEFTDLNSLGKPDFIQIVPLDEEREKQYRTQRKKKIKEQIDQQTGFRWVVEAMIGGDLSRLDPLSFAMNANGDAEFVDLRYIKDQFFRAAEGLRHKPRVLVGHNMFTDLMYFYRTFIGELPETVSEWQTTIHELFPLIIDTKYLATHECGDINPFSSLEEIEEKLRWQRIPEIQIHKDHTKYVKGTDSFHEAGYDSLLTANVMIRLSAKLDAEGTYIGGIPSDDEQNYVTAPEDNGGISLDAEDGTTFGKKLRQVSRLVPEYNIKASPNAASSTYSASNWLVPSSVGPPSKKKKKKATSKKSQDKNGSRFASPTMFEGLRIEEAEELEAEDSAAAWQSRLTVETEAQSVSGSGPLSWDLDVPATDSLGPYALPEIKKKEAMVMMPQFDSDFWRVYGNKLRVFGTEENVLALTG